MIHLNLSAEIRELSLTFVYHCLYSLPGLILEIAFEEACEQKQIRYLTNFTKSQPKIS
jgi:hypothetical protein